MSVQIRHIQAGNNHKDSADVAKWYRLAKKGTFANSNPWILLASKSVLLSMQN